MNKVIKMKNTIYHFYWVLILSSIVFSSCSTTHKTISQPDTYLQLKRSDFEISELKTASATTKQILCIDWNRIFKKTKANGNNMKMNDIDLWSFYYSYPVIGPIAYDYIIDKTTDYAFYELMKTNPGYDVIMYPQVEREIKRPIGMGWIYREINVTVSGRLAKIK